MLIRANKTRGQVILETVIVVIILAVVAIGAITLFSNVNFQMLDRLSIFRRTRLHALNNPNAPALRKAVSVAPASAKATRALRDPTTYLDYLPKGGVSIIPDVPSGAFGWDDFEFDATSYEIQLALGLVLRYKFNQLNWISGQAAFNRTPSYYFWSPNMNYIYVPKKIIYQIAGLLLTRSYSSGGVWGVMSKLITQYEENPARAEAARNALYLTFAGMRTELYNIRSALGRVLWNRWAQAYDCSPDHIEAVAKIQMLIGQQAYTVKQILINESTFEPILPIQVINAVAENPLRALFDDAGVDCPECFDSLIADPFFDPILIPKFQQLSSNLAYYRDLTRPMAQKAFDRVVKIKNEHPEIIGTPIYNTFLLLYTRLNYLLTTYKTSPEWRGNSTIATLMKLCQLEAWALYRCVEVSRP